MNGMLRHKIEQPYISKYNFCFTDIHYTTGKMAELNFKKWKKFMPFKKLFLIGKFHTKKAPANIIIGQKYILGKKFAHGAFGQVITFFSKLNIVKSLYHI